MWKRVWDCRVNEKYAHVVYVLNNTYLHAETWDVLAKRKFIENKIKMGSVYKEQEVDYRRSFARGKVISRCTGHRQYDVHTFPHRLFFGVSKQAYDGNKWHQPGCGRWYRNAVIPGKVEISEGERYLPVSEDVEIVLFYLRIKGLPTELGLKVIKLADFKPERKLPIAGDPLNLRNRGKLRKYLSWCWKVLVWCDIFMSADGHKISWVYEISDMIGELWGGDGNSGKRMFRYFTRDEEDDIDTAMNGDRELSIPGRRLMFT